MAVCNVCFRHCHLEEGKTGFCGGRTVRNGVVTAGNYGKITGLALDPIEKKPLNRFFPGSRILSVGSYGCNLRCPFCQNHEISWSEHAWSLAERVETITPEKLADLADSLRNRGNIGVAFTYNEPLIGYEFVRDTAKQVHERGMKNVLVTNGTASLQVLEELAPYIDAMNIDFKGFQDSFYSDILHGSREMVMSFIEQAARVCHIELTTLIIPGENDSEEEMRMLSSWIAGLKAWDGRTIGSGIPQHITRFFPQFHMTDRPPTDIGKLFRLVEIAKENLDYVYPGNV